MGENKLLAGSMNSRQVLKDISPAVSRCLHTKGCGGFSETMYLNTACLESLLEKIVL